MKTARNIISFVLIACFIFRPYFIFLPPAVVAVFFDILPLVYMAYNYGYFAVVVRNIIDNKCMCIAVLSFVLVILISLLTVTYNNSNDMSYMGHWHFTFSSVAWAFCVAIYSYKSSGEQGLVCKVIDIYCSVCSLYVLVTVIMLLLPELRLLWASYIAYPDTMNSQASIIGDATRFGWIGVSLFSESVRESICVLLSLYMLYIGKKRGILYFIFGLLGNVFYGRIGVLLSVVCICVFLFRVASVKFLIRVLTVILLFIGMFYMLINIETNIMVDVWLEWLLEPYESFIHGSQYGQMTLGVSGDDLVETMYFMPNVETLILGDGYYIVNGGYYMGTDAGYMRSILFFGIGGTFCQYLLVLLPIFAVRNYAAMLGNREMACVAECLAVTMLIAEYKGYIFVLFIFVTMMLFSALAIETRRKLSDTQ